MSQSLITDITSGFEPSDLSSFHLTTLDSNLTLVPCGLRLMVFLQTEPELPWVSIIALLADRLQVNLIELGFDCHLLVTGAAGEVVNTPGLVEGSEHIGLDHLIANIAEISKKLVVVGLTVGKPFPLVVPVAQERFLTLGTDKVLHTPVFAKGGYNSLLYGSPACPTDRDSHLVMAAEAVQLIELLCSVARAGSHLSCSAGEFLATPCAVEVIGAVGLTTESQRFSFNGTVTLLAHVLSTTPSFHLSIALMAEGPPLVLDES